MYSETAIEHFSNPQNLHSMRDADAMGSMGDPACGDTIAMFIKVEDNVIQNISSRSSYSVYEQMTIK